MTGQVNVIESRDSRPMTRGKVAMYEFDWTADENGDVDGEMAFLCGFIRMVETVPGGVAPSTGHDVQVLDENGLDVLQGKGLGRSSTNAEMGYPIDTPVNGPLTLQVSEAGSGGQGKIFIFLE